MFKIKTLLRFGLFALAVSSSSYPAFAQTAAQPITPKIKPITELGILEDKIGTGAEAVEGNIVTMHYTAWLYSYSPRKPDHKGRQFDSTVARNQPDTFTLGSGKKIKGIDQGVAGMKVGGKRTLIIPPDLAYGPRGIGRGAIPPNTPMLFEVELLDVKEAKPQ